MKKILITLILGMFLLSFASAIQTNVSILHGNNGSDIIPILLTEDGKQLWDIEGDLVLGNLTVTGNTTSGWFNGLFNWTVNFVDDYIFGNFDGGTLTIELNKTKINETGDLRWLQTTGDNATGNYNFVGNINVSSNITVMNRIFLEDKNHWIKHNASELYDGIAQDTTWIHNAEDKVGGTLAFLISAISGGINRTLFGLQVGRNNSGSFIGNSLIIVPNNLSTNLSVMSDCFEIAEVMGKQIRIPCDSSDMGAELLVTGDLQVFARTFLDSGLDVRGDVDFFGIGTDFDIFNSSLHLRTPVVREIGLGEGETSILINSNFEDGTLQQFSQVSEGSGIAEWLVVQDANCNDDECARARGTSGGLIKIMEANFSMVDRNSSNLSFFYTTSNIEGGDLFNVTINNNEGSGELVLFSTSSSVSNSQTNVSVPALMDNRSLVTLRFRFNANNPINEEVFVDDILLLGNTTASSLENITRLDSEIKFGAGLGDGILYTGDEETGSSEMNFTADRINFIGSVTEVNVTEVNLNITNSLTVGNNVTIGGWFNGLFNFSILTNWLNFDDGSTLIFNESRLNISLLAINTSATGYTDFVNNSQASWISDTFVNVSGDTMTGRLNIEMADTNMIINNTGSSGTVFEIWSNGTAGSVADLKINAPNPDIELIEIDQTSPAGRYEIAVNGNDFQINSRNQADNSFETIMEFDQLRQTTGFARLFMDLNVSKNILALGINATSNICIDGGDCLSGLNTSATGYTNFVNTTAASYTLFVNSTAGSFTIATNATAGSYTDAIAVLLQANITFLNASTIIRLNEATQLLNINITNLNASVTNRFTITNGLINAVNTTTISNLSTVYDFINSVNITTTSNLSIIYGLIGEINSTTILNLSTVYLTMNSINTTANIIELADGGLNSSVWRSNSTDAWLQDVAVNVNFTGKILINTSRDDVSINYGGSSLLQDYQSNTVWSNALFFNGDAWEYSATVSGGGLHFIAPDGTYGYYVIPAGNDGDTFVLPSVSAIGIATDMTVAYSDSVTIGDNTASSQSLGFDVTGTDGIWTYSGSSTWFSTGGRRILFGSSGAGTGWLLSNWVMNQQAGGTATFNPSGSQVFSMTGSTTGTLASIINNNVEGKIVSLKGSGGSETFYANKTATTSVLDFYHNDDSFGAGDYFLTGGIDGVDEQVNFLATKNFTINVPTGGGNNFRFNLDSDHSFVAEFINPSGAGAISINATGGIRAGGTIGSVGEATFGGVSGDGAGKAVCIKAGGDLGTCTNTVGAGGTCICA